MSQREAQLEVDNRKQDEPESGSARPSAIRADIVKGLGLLSLLLGLLLLDRCFTAWRVDSRSFPDQNGHYLPADTPVTVRRLNNIGTRKALTAAGVGLLALSTLMFSGVGHPRRSPIN